MKNRLLLYVLVIVLFLCTSCNSLNKEIASEDELENLSIMPYNQRKFIYQNGLNVEYEQNSVNEDNKYIEKYYPQINGLINKEVEKNINNDIVNLVNMHLKKAENFITKKYPDPVIQSISTSAFVNYSCNNVIFIEFSSYVNYNAGTVSEGYYIASSVGYDLNTGNKLSLKDLFINGIDYNTLLNNHIYMEIIKSNYDDPDSLYMNKPFQGIRNNQSFSFNENRLSIIMDEQNDEFNTTGYPVTIDIPLKEIGSDLAIFDRYFNEEENIFVSDRIKKLMPNYQYYEVNDGIMEYDEYYNIHIEAGEFKNMDDFKTKQMLEAMVSQNLDVDSFRERAKDYSSSYPGKYYGNLYHVVDVMMSSGGYLSMNAFSSKNENNTIENHEKHINFDLNNNKMMTLKDIFAEGFDYKTEILEILRAFPKYSLPEGTFSENEEILFAENDFNFNSDAVFIILYQPGAHVREYKIWIEYKDIGYENISILQWQYNGRIPLNQ